jgi:hypothetical protein
MTGIIIPVFLLFYLRAYSTAQRPIINNARAKERIENTWTRTEEKARQLVSALYVYISISNATYYLAPLL